MALPDTVAGKLLGPAFPGGMEKWIPFDAAKSQARWDELAAAIDQFIEAANTELSQ